MAYVLIALAVFIYALYPSAILKFVSGNIDIVSYLLVFHLVAASARVAMATFYGKSSFAQESDVKLSLFDRRIVDKETVGLGTINAVFDILGFGCFFFAIYFGNAVQATVFYELWASAFLLLTMFLRRNQPGQFDHHHGEINTTIFFTLGVIGVVLVVTSPEKSSDLSTENYDNLFGLTVLAAAVASPIFMAISFYLGTKNARIISNRLKNLIKSEQISDPTRAGEKADFLAGIYHGVFLRILGSIILITSMTFLYSMHVWTPEFPALNIWVVLGIILCALISTAGGALADISNNVSSTSNLNQFWSFTPFFAVILLNAFGYTNDTSRELYFGAILILSANYILLSKSAYSKSFIASIFFLCAVYAIILFLPPVQTTQGFQHVTVPLGIFGIFAAFFIDRIMKDSEASKMSPPNTSVVVGGSANGGGLFYHNIFILWILGLGSVVSMVLFRPEGNLALEFISAFVSVAVIYICLLPIEFLMRPTLAEDGTLTEGREDKPFLSLLMSALFIAVLFVLYLFALLQDARLI